MPKRRKPRKRPRRAQLTKPALVGSENDETDATTWGAPSEGIVEAGNQPEPALSRGTEAPPLPISTSPEPTAETVAGLAGQFLSGHLQVSYRTLLGVAAMLAPVAIVWTIIQDNGAGRLDAWTGIGWWGIKAGIVLGVVAVLTCLGCGALWLMRKFE